METTWRISIENCQQLHLPDKEKLGNIDKARRPLAQLVMLTARIAIRRIVILPINHLTGVGMRSRIT
jgi:hypothetical protein